MERLPNEGQRILINSISSYNKKPYVEIAFYTLGWEIDFDDEDDDWPEAYNKQLDKSFLPKGFWFNGEDEEKFWGRDAVTHWMPLPNPPKQQ